MFLTNLLCVDLFCSIYAQYQLTNHTLSCSLRAELFLNSIMRLKSINFLLHLLPVVWHTPVSQTESTKTMCSRCCWCIPGTDFMTYYQPITVSTEAINDFSRKKKSPGPDLSFYLYYVNNNYIYKKNTTVLFIFNWGGETCIMNAMGHEWLSRGSTKLLYIYCLISN